MLWLGNALRSLLDSPHKGSTARSFDVFSCVSVDKLLNKRARCRRFETPWRSSDVIVVVAELIQSLWPSNIIWRHRYGSTLAQVMACCLAAPSHYLNQCWLTIKGVLWHLPESNFTRSIHGCNPQYVFEDCTFKITITSSPQGLMSLCMFLGEDLTDHLLAVAKQPMCVNDVVEKDREFVYNATAIPEVNIRFSGLQLYTEYYIRYQCIWFWCALCCCFYISSEFR